MCSESNVFYYTWCTRRFMAPLLLVTAANPSPSLNCRRGWACSSWVAHWSSILQWSFPDGSRSTCSHVTRLSIHHYMQLVFKVIFGSVFLSQMSKEKVCMILKRLFLTTDSNIIRLRLEKMEFSNATWCKYGGSPLHRYQIGGISSHSIAYSINEIGPIKHGDSALF